MASDTLLVNELFGPTFQGEGKNLGMPAVFLRLTGCNLRCRWCDTPHAWDWTRFDREAEVHQMTVDDVYSWLDQQPVRNLVITGGEPLLQQEALHSLTKRLHGAKWWTELETSGTVMPRTIEMVKLWTVSPKLGNSGNPIEKRVQPDVLRRFWVSNRAVLKFVVESLEDFEEVDAIVAELPRVPVYIMPQGVTTTVLNERSRAIAEAAVARGYYLTTRLHIALYGERRGV